LKKDYIFTFVAEFLVLLSGILVYKFAATVLGKDGFSEYALSRRTVSFIQPILIMGFGVGIPRYIAFASASSNSKKADTYFIGGICVLSLVALSFTIIVNLFRDKFAFLMLGNSRYYHLIFPISLMLIGFVFHSACYSNYRGRLLMLKANFLQIINLGFVPLFAFAVSKSTRQVLFITGFCWLEISLVFLFFILKHQSWERMNILRYTKELIKFGLQRVPGDFGLAAILTLPAIFTAHLAGVREAGYVAFGISILNMAGSVFAPIGLILLPTVSKLISEKNFSTLKSQINKILKITLFFSIIGIIFFETFAVQIIRMYLGKNFINLILVSRVIIVGSLAYNIYISMRSIIDACYVRAINTINIFISLAVSLMTLGMGIIISKHYILIVICFLIGLFSLAGLTLREIKKIILKTNIEC
jgi:O-antigen/teichoic acid export membrane protein